MGYIAASKFGDCSRCDSTSVACRKRGKDLVCIFCCNIEDTKKQEDKAKERNKLRSLVSSDSNKNAINGKNPELEIWFIHRRKEMTGICACGCGQETSRNDDKYYRHCLAHVLPKAKFKSIATHPLNCIELAFWGGCHTTFDDMGYEYCKNHTPILWEKVVKRFKVLYPRIAPTEYQYIPDVLLNELNHL